MNASANCMNTKFVLWISPMVSMRDGALEPCFISSTVYRSIYNFRRSCTVILATDIVNCGRFHHLNLIHGLYHSHCIRLFLYTNFSASSVFPTCTCAPSYVVSLLENTLSSESFFTVLCASELYRLFLFYCRQM